MKKKKTGWDDKSSSRNKAYAALERATAYQSANKDNKNKDSEILKHFIEVKKHSKHLNKNQRHLLEESVLFYLAKEQRRENNPGWKETELDLYKFQWDRVKNKDKYAQKAKIAYSLAVAFALFNNKNFSKDEESLKYYKNAEKFLDHLNDKEQKNVTNSINFLNKKTKNKHGKTN